jgi:hypothetical protein
MHSDFQKRNDRNTKCLLHPTYLGIIKRGSMKGRWPWLDKPMACNAVAALTFKQASAGNRGSVRQAPRPLRRKALNSKGSEMACSLQWPSYWKRFRRYALSKFIMMLKCHIPDARCQVVAESSEVMSSSNTPVMQGTRRARMKQRG